MSSKASSRHPLLPKAERPHVNGTMLIPFWHMLVSIHQPASANVFVDVDNHHHIHHVALALVLIVTLHL